MLKGADVIKAGSTTVDRRRLRRVLETVRDKSAWDRASFGKTTVAEWLATRTPGALTSPTLWMYRSITKTTSSVERVVAAVDCGRVVNPVGVEQQMESGIIWGISSALKGEITFDGGAAQQSNFADFAVARMRDTPAMEIHIIDSDAPLPFGMGEPPVPPIVPAIANAIFSATGRRISRLPIRPEQLKQGAA